MCKDSGSAHRAFRAMGLVGYLRIAGYLLVFCQHFPYQPLRAAQLTYSLDLTAMMAFSASYSARFHEHQQSNAEDSLNHQRSLRDHWVRRGVSARGEIWSANFEQRLEQEGFTLHHNMWDCEQTVENIGQDEESEDEGLGASDQASTSSHASHSAKPVAAVLSFPPPPLLPSPSSSSRMAIKAPFWISAWFILTVPVIFWDASYCFMRPRSMRGGDLHWIWSPYAMYQDVDYVYGLRAFENQEGFTNAQSFMNVAENILNILYLYLAHVQGSPIAPLIGFTSIVMTLSKTILYWLNEYFCGWCSIGHNDFATLFLYWIIPNGIWLVFPTVILSHFGLSIASTLRLAAKVDKKKAQ
ncbi:uncharacterized protein PHACADRAFT_266214 [Phanerochaete carnosa HHB-10118-sp]|uniref:EXPERA domain-containing protein n=1 Tax=Phanerochaete carnosa (strain HHB-10118-sp) TaxID=650164 RepID=K5WES3_PHACS|nr:uncharacterized protein PHACADRAFT_266214 [Phanerochaete carnosa HHB-10118-sp]EKM48672.1 hypothetical protein PHACADRAFT_266214 [Phanerochaete carnosa HHB-10118-sp]